MKKFYLAHCSSFLPQNHLQTLAITRNYLLKDSLGCDILRLHHYIGEGQA